MIGPIGDGIAKCLAVIIPAVNKIHSPHEFLLFCAVFFPIPDTRDIFSLTGFQI